jgi:Metallopeptidase family M24
MANRLHTTGYSIGAGVPPSWGEPLNMFGGSKVVLRAGMVVSIEPPVFVAEECIGARIIDNVLVTESGAELLSTYPLDLLVVDWRLSSSSVTPNPLFASLEQQLRLTLYGTYGSIAVRKRQAAGLRGDARPYRPASLGAPW